MSISSRFTVGIHILALLELNKDQVNSSEVLAESVNTNPAVIRKIMGMLKKANLINVQPGIAGSTLTKSASDITLLAVYKAVNVVKENELFSLHDNTSQSCIVGRNIQHAIEPMLINAQHIMEQSLENLTIADVLKGIIENED